MSLPPPAAMDVADVDSSSSPLPLHLLPASLYPLITQFLPLPDKLLHLTHVCHSFPPVTPLSFACDTVAWTPTLIAQLTSSPSPSLLSLLSLIPSALCVDPPQSCVDAVCHLLIPLSPLSSSSSPASQLVTCTGASEAKGEKQAALSLPVPSAVRLGAHLSALSVCSSLPSAELAPLFSCLSLLPFLHTLRLTLDGNLDDAELERCCSPCP